MVCPRARRSRARQPHRSTSAGLDLGAGQADRLGDVRPRGDGALHSCPGAAASVRPPGNGEQERAEAEDLRHRRRERTEQRRRPRASRPPRARWRPRRRARRAGAGRRVRRIGTARTRPGRRRQAGTPTSAGAWRGATSPPRGPRPPWWRARSRSGTATRAGPGAPRRGRGSGLSMTTMGCRPARRARRVCLRICR